MHDDTTKNWIAKVNQIANEMIYPEGFTNAGQKILGGKTPIECFELTETGVDSLKSLVTGIYQKVSGKFSLKYIEDKIFKILHEAVSQRSCCDVDSAILRFVLEYESYTTRYSVTVPLVGIRVGTEPIYFGEVTLRLYDDIQVDSVSKNILMIISGNTLHSEEAKQSYYTDMRVNYVAKLKGKTCAEILVLAEPIRAKEIAVEKVRQVIGLLRYGVLCIFTDEYPRAIGILGEVSDEHLQLIAIKQDLSGANFGTKLINHQFGLDTANCSRLRELGVFELSNLICANTRSEFHSTLLRAISWLASAQTQFDNQNVILCLMTCLETFFSSEQGNPITATIAEGVALVLKCTVADRKIMKKRVSDLYGLRSKIAHGKTSSISLKDLGDLKSICRALTGKMIEHRDKFTSLSEFREWLDNQKLATQVDFPLGTTAT